METKTIILLIGIAIPILIYFMPKILEKIKKSPKKESKKVDKNQTTSTKATRDKSSGKVIEVKSNSFAAIIGYIIGLTLAAVVLMWGLGFVLKVWRNTFPSKPKEEIVSLPSSYTKSYYLIKGDQPIRVNIPRGYDCETSEDGRLYYFKPAYSTKQIAGDGRNIDYGDNVPYFDLSYYNEEFLVVCKFTRE